MTMKFKRIGEADADLVSIPLTDRTGRCHNVHHSGGRQAEDGVDLSLLSAPTIIMKIIITRYMFKRTQSLSNASLRSRPIIIKFM